MSIARIPLLLITVLGTMVFAQTPPTRDWPVYGGDAGGTRAHAVAFDDEHGQAALGGPPRRREPDQPAADDDRVVATSVRARCQALRMLVAR